MFKYRLHVYIYFKFRLASFVVSNHLIHTVQINALIYDYNHIYLRGDFADFRDYSVAEV